jgi:hypothetical protein
MRISDLVNRPWLERAYAGRCGILALGLLLVACVPRLHAQRSVDPNPTGSPYPYGSGPIIGSGSSPRLNPLDAKMQQTRLNALNAARQQSLVSDTDKLVKLAAQLNAQINSAHQAQLTPDQLRTVAEIEKLAKSIREKMSDAESGAPSFSAPAGIGFPSPPGMP